MCCIGHAHAPIETPLHAGAPVALLLANQAAIVRRSVVAAFTAAGLEASEEQIRACSYIKSRFCPVTMQAIEDNLADSVWCGRATHEFIKGLQESGHLLESSGATCECCFCAITRVGGGRHPAFLGYPLPEGGPSCSQPLLCAAAVAPVSEPISVTLVTGAGVTFCANPGGGPVASPSRPLGPITGVSVSYAVIHFAEKAGISNQEAEAVLAYLKPADGHRTNALLSQRVFARFARDNEIPVAGAIGTMREWAEGRE